MIKGTYADCKIRDIKVTGNTAYVTLLIYSTKPADNHRAFMFYLSDQNTSQLAPNENHELLRLSTNRYWIDYTHNYDNNIANIDVNMYREIILEIDITKGNMGTLVDNHWVRECQIILFDVTDTENTAFATAAWISSPLTLISKEIILPTIKNLAFISDSNWKLYVEYDYEYPTQEDFNSQSRNIYTDISVISNTTRKVLETRTVREAYIKDGHVMVEFDGKYDDYIRIRLTVRNQKNVGMMEIEKLYKPIKMLESTWVKKNGRVSRVYYVYYKGKKNIISTSGFFNNDSFPVIEKEKIVVYENKEFTFSIRAELPDKDDVSNYVGELWVDGEHNRDFHIEPTNSYFMESSKKQVVEFDVKASQFQSLQDRLARWIEEARNVPEPPTPPRVDFYVRGNIGSPRKSNVITFSGGDFFGLL